jgi:hypothetical protein
MARSSSDISGEKPKSIREHIIEKKEVVYRNVPVLATTEMWVLSSPFDAIIILMFIIMFIMIIVKK